MGPDEQVFRAHIEMGPFQSGLERGRWRLISVEWPFAVIAVSAAPRLNAPQEYVLRFDLTNYPHSAPTARLWEIERDAPVGNEKHPQGKSRVTKAFPTDWKEGCALYLPCDRVAMNGHDDWRSKHPAMIWEPHGDITKYLRIVHDLLNSNDYTGTRSS